MLVGLADLASCLKAADGPNDPAATTPAKNGLPQDLTKVSHAGYDAIRDVHAARLAIFNGDPKVAIEMIDKAKKDLDDAAKDAEKFAADEKVAGHENKGDEKSASDKMDLIPIDGNIAIADTFVATPEKKEHIAKANEHFKAGRSKEALEELRLGEIDVVYTRAMLPWKATQKRVDEAEKLASDHEYYEANLALKAAEDGLVMESVDLQGNPVPANKTAAITPTK